MKYERDDNYELLRAHAKCSICGGPKLEGTLMCNYCHREEVSASSGAYSISTITRLVVRERDLAAGKAK